MFFSRKVWHAGSVMLATREDNFIKQFISAYEDGSWADADVTKPDAIDRTNKAVDQLATRKSDGRTLAVEHTIIEPFVGDKGDFAEFEKTFLDIENDKTLAVHGRWLEVFVPVGSLRKQPPVARSAKAQAVHTWIKSNRLTLPEGRGVHACPVDGTPGKPSFDITLNVRVTPLKRGDRDEPGILHIRRQQMDVNLGDVVEKALRNKVPKLVNTKAEKRILLLERQHMILVPEMMLKAIEDRRASFPDLAVVDEIWIIETMFYGTAFGGTNLRFELYGTKGNLIHSFDFDEGKLIRESEDGWAKVIQQVP
jgi:hypothetical protein